MGRKILFLSLIGMTILSVALFGCKGKVEKAAEGPRMEGTETIAQMEATTQPQAPAIVEPAQTVATETIPPTAAPQIAEKIAAPAVKMVEDSSKDIQTALKNAGFYTGTIDGKIGPKTKKAIEEFQAAKGLKADGKVGPKTWAELAKYLAQQ